jgi:hypothetical protein
VVVECKFLSSYNWEMIKVRPDKPLPNSMYVYHKTLLNIQEDISIQELFAFC